LIQSTLSETPYQLQIYAQDDSTLPHFSADVMMAYYGTNPQSSVPPMQHVPMQRHQVAAISQIQQNMQIRQMQMNRQALIQNQMSLAASNASNQKVVPHGPNKTLELKQIAATMGPTSLSLYQPSLIESFTKLPRDDAGLIGLVECFTFHYRQRQPHEPTVMPNASLYFTKLQQSSSLFAMSLEQVIGFRCCACRHTTQMPGAYRVGAAQLLACEFLGPESVCKSLLELRTHMSGCPDVPPEFKGAFSNSSSICTGNGKTSLDQYIFEWIQALKISAHAKGFPPIKATPTPIPPHTPSKRTVPGRNGTLQNVGRSSVDPSVGVLRAALGSAPMQQQQLARHFALQQGALATAGKRGYTATAVQTLPAASQTITNLEEELFSDLQRSVEVALMESNFGLQSFKSRRLVTDLSELPTESSHGAVAPLLEVLLQSLCAVQRWTAAGEKRSNQDMPESSSQIRKARVFIECIYCNDSSHSFCVSTGTAREAADFIFEAGYKHLCLDCQKAPSSLKQKLVKLKSSFGIEQCNMQTRIIEENFKQWIHLFPDHEKIGKKTSQEATNVKFWRPLTWGFLQETRGAAVRTDKLACDDVSAVLLGRAGKTLPYTMKDDDVLIGWNGALKGNIAFLYLLDSFRKAFVEASPVQQNVIASFAVSTVATRGGRFYAVNPTNYIMPPTVVPPKEAVDFALRTLKYGAMVLIKPPQDHTKAGRGSCVLDSEVVPQRDVFSNEIVRNKRLKLQIGTEGAAKKVWYE
jgi:hypothetical protein